MYEIQPKKLMIINILDILKKYSDEDHRLTQKDIIELLKRDYNMTVDRKSVKSNLMTLLKQAIISTTVKLQEAAKTARKILFSLTGILLMISPTPNSACS